MELFSHEFINEDLWSVGVFLSTICLSLYFAYQWALPRPIPDIPHNPGATRRMFGDIPDMFDAITKTGKPPLAWILDQSRKLQSPVIQIFIRPFAKPRVVLCDFREGQDILMRRKEFDRSRTMGDLFSGLVPRHHIHQPTNSIWKGNRRLLQDLMSPNFLHGIAGPTIHQNALNLVKLWRLKASLAKGRPFSASDDVYHAALDAVLAFSFGKDFPHSATRPNVALLSRLSLDEVSNLEKRADQDKIMTFPELQPDSAIAATLDLAIAIEDIQGSVVPRWRWWFKERMTSLGKTLQVKNAYITNELERAARRIQDSDMTATEVQSAVDLMLLREKKLAEKEGREPTYVSPTLCDEAFGFVVAGHDTTSTTILWALKFLADSPAIQTRLRAALKFSFSEASVEERNPTIEEITRTHIPYLDASMEEILRCAGTVPGLDRVALCDTELLGYKIPKGTTVLILGQGPSMRSPAFKIDEKDRSETCQNSKAQGKLRAWSPEDIEAFNPERWLVPVPAEKQDELKSTTGDIFEFDASAGPQLAFGLGLRSCFGKRLAFLELRILLSLIIWNFELEQCPEELSGYQQDAGITYKPHSCYVRLKDSGLVSANNV